MGEDMVEALEDMVETSTDLRPFQTYVQTSGSLSSRMCRPTLAQQPCTFNQPPTRPQPPMRPQPPPMQPQRPREPQRPLAAMEDEEGSIELVVFYSNAL